MAVKTKRDGTLKIEDALGAFVEVAFEEGDLKFEINRNPQEILVRGKLNDILEGDEESVKGSFSTYFTQFLQGAGATPTVYEALLRKGGASTWTSTWTNPCAFYTVKMTFTLQSSTCGGAAEVITFNYVYVKKIGFEEGETDKISFDFIDYETEPSIA